MLVEFTYDRTSVIHALRVHFLSRSEVKFLRITLLILFGITVVGNLLGYVSFGAVFGIFMMILLLLLIFWFWLPVLTYNKSATFKDNIRLQVEDQGMAIGTRSGEHMIRWESFRNVVETRDYIYLYRNTRSFFIIPWSAFREEDRQAFRNLLHSKFASYEVNVSH
ncbi:YcxB family protein [Thermoflavifilum thermophilum]|uniref:YcxB-like protein n=1 Tax=Thermoflavifilum thermophilum TaxID=1393122 RepID=A0A1I7N6B9_9BACT|nr:YcxB family protein [Thermoflavifilum thermophilum]SFV30201.1 YcxB-like protein [Thermoflavifilum thermophilum]